MIKWYHIRAGMAWMIGALIALIGLLGAAVAATAQITLTRETADGVYETKEHADAMYTIFQQHQMTLERIENKLDVVLEKQQKHEVINAR